MFTFFKIYDTTMSSKKYWFPITQPILLCNSKYKVYIPNKNQNKQFKQDHLKFKKSSKKVPGGKMLSIVNSMALHGLNGYLVSVEVDVSAGLPRFWNCADCRT